MLFYIATTKIPAATAKSLTINNTTKDLMKIRMCFPRKAEGGSQCAVLYPGASFSNSPWF